MLDADRGRRQDRGYDREHEMIRRQLMDALRVRQAKGLVTLCPRCGKPMTTTQRLEAGHSVDLRVDPTAKADRLEHAPCNQAWRAHDSGDRQVDGADDDHVTTDDDQ
jgi:hypothetical protein